jgi:hypothetical protein
VDGKRFGAGEAELLEEVDPRGGCGVGLGLSSVLQGTDTSLCNISCALILLTVEWVMSKHSRNDGCNIILRLQDDGSTTGLDDGGSREPISLVFDGVYE